MKINNHIAALAIISIALTSACSTSKTKQQAYSPASFETRISVSGLKHFEVRHRKTTQNDSSEDRYSATADSRKTLARELRGLKKLAENMIKNNQYCLNGFWVLDADSDHAGSYLRGECNELASDNDRRNFPDSIKNW